MGTVSNFTGSALHIHETNSSLLKGHEVEVLQSYCCDDYYNYKQSDAQYSWTPVYI